MNLFLKCMVFTFFSRCSQYQSHFWLKMFTMSISFSWYLLLTFFFLLPGVWVTLGFLFSGLSSTAILLNFLFLLLLARNSFFIEHWPCTWDFKKTNLKGWNVFIKGVRLHPWQLCASTLPFSSVLVQSVCCGCLRTLSFDQNYQAHGTPCMPAPARFALSSPNHTHRSTLDTLLKVAVTKLQAARSPATNK